MLFAVAIGSAGMLFWPQIQGSSAGGLSSAAAVQLMNREKTVAIIDVCEPTEFANEHIRGAKNVPLSQLADKLPGLVKNKEVPLLLVCASGMRSKRALSVAKKLGYVNAQSMTGGHKAWKEANLPLEKA